MNIYVQVVVSSIWISGMNMLHNNTQEGHGGPGTLSLIFSHGGTFVKDSGII